MGRDAKVRLIEWTGERCVPWTEDLQGSTSTTTGMRSRRGSSPERVLDLASAKATAAP